MNRREQATCLIYLSSSSISSSSFSSSSLSLTSLKPLPLSIFPTLPKKGRQHMGPVPFILSVTLSLHWHGAIFSHSVGMPYVA